MEYCVQFPKKVVGVQNQRQKFIRFHSTRKPLFLIGERSKKVKKFTTLNKKTSPVTQSGKLMRGGNAEMQTTKQFKMKATGGVRDTFLCTA